MPAGASWPSLRYLRRGAGAAGARGASAALARTRDSAMELLLLASGSPKANGTHLRERAFSR